MAARQDGGRPYFPRGVVGPQAASRPAPSLQPITVALTIREAGALHECACAFLLVLQQEPGLRFDVHALSLRRGAAALDKALADAGATVVDGRWVEGR